MGDHLRSKALGDWGERKALQLLERAGFTKVRDLNLERRNHPFGDISAERHGQGYVIGVRTRNRLQQNGRLNSTYNVQAKSMDVERLVSGMNAVAAWVAIQVDAPRQTFSAYFGLLNALQEQGERFSIPMGTDRTTAYEALALEERDPNIHPEWDNRLPGDAGAVPPSATRSHVIPDGMTAFATCGLCWGPVCIPVGRLSPAVCASCGATPRPLYGPVLAMKLKESSDG